MPEETNEVEPLIEGVIPLFLRPTTTQEYGLSTGPGVLDIVPFKYLNKAQILDQVLKRSGSKRILLF